jgi:malate synthase
MEEILYEIREHAAGLNVGRWDKIFSDIKAIGEHRDRVMADRASIGMERPWMRDYARRLVEICHRRGAAAIGGMAAFTPGRSEERRAEQTAKVVADKKAEAAAGHDGCWVSHPYFIGPALSAFPRDHQRDVVTPGYDKYPDLLPQGGGPRTLDGLRKNVRVGIAYLRGWQADLGCVAWDDLMEDLATLEISRAQTWQWARHRIRLDDDGGTVDVGRIRATFAGELERILTEVPADEHDAYRRAAQAAEEIFTRPRLAPFLSEESEPA